MSLCTYDNLESARINWLKSFLRKKIIQISLLFYFSFCFYFVLLLALLLFLLYCFWCDTFNIPHSQFKWFCYWFWNKSNNFVRNSGKQIFRRANQHQLSQCEYVNIAQINCMNIEKKTIISILFYVWQQRIIYENLFWRMVHCNCCLCQISNIFVRLHSKRTETNRIQWHYIHLEAQ